ncbi:MAG: hypothetical protein MJ168_03635 [Clostridia bacterium]|nr:hypothetical protein [Clostridia bacterium]
MIEKDTIRLLRECDAGIKMGVDSINDVLNDVSNDEFKKLLSDCRNEHEKLNSEIQSLLDEYGDDGKDPNPMAKGMSWIKTNAKMAWDGSDNTIADLMTDGCNMGVKSLSKYLNQYKAASEKTKDIAKKLIAIEGTLSTDMRPYL